LPRTVELFYTEVGPVDVTIQGCGNPYFLPRLSRLWKYQAGYRYHAHTKEPINDWKPNWLVVGDEGGDPLIYDSDTETVLQAIHGEGTWDPDEAFPDLNSMAACLATIGTVVVEAGNDLTDEESYIKSKYCSQLRKRLGRILESPEHVELVLLGLGCE
jgi:hypothetical protein